MQEGAQDSAVCQTHDIQIPNLPHAGMRRQERRNKEGADDDADVIHTDGDGGQPEDGVRLQQTHKQATDAEDEGGEHHQAHHLRHQLLLVKRALAIEHEADQLRREDVHQQAE